MSVIETIALIELVFISMGFVIALIGTTISILTYLNKRK